MISRRVGLSGEIIMNQLVFSGATATVKSQSPDDGIQPTEVIVVL
jgi:hypothetical protein